LVPRGLDRLDVADPLGEVGHPSGFGPGGLTDLLFAAIKTLEDHRYHSRLMARQRSVATSGHGIYSLELGKLLAYMAKVL